MNNRTKARFKGAMRFIKNNEDTLKKDSLARKLLSKNDKEFWKEIRVMNSSNMPLANVTDGVTGSVNSVDMWKSHCTMICSTVSERTKMSNNSILMFIMTPILR